MEESTVEVRHTADHERSNCVGHLVVVGDAGGNPEIRLVASEGDQRHDRDLTPLGLVYDRQTNSKDGYPDELDVD